MDCLDEHAAIALVQGSLVSTARYDKVHAHVESCDSCRRLVAALARMPSVRRAVDTPEPPGEPPERIAERYELDGLLGAGGMGIVYRARDAQLARVVAIKRVRRSGGGDAHARLVAEARAMAQLAHPNVVAVFDAGHDGGAAYVAMELVEGETLRAWIERRHAWRAIGRMFVETAHGLAAAHAAGLVHGDFKPDNVLIDAHGRPRVADFGLARSISAAPEERGLAGTPAYMAPELLEGAPSSAASDQYAWATALHEAIYGRRPFAASTIDELREAQQQRRPPLPRVRGVPSSILRVVDRALAADPAARFPSMTAAAAALAAIPQRRARLAIAAAVGATALTSGAIAWAATSGSDGVSAPACRDGAELLAEVWSADRAAALKSTSLAGSPEVAAAVVTTLDAYGERWRTRYVEACEATRSGAQSGEMLDLHMHCLDVFRGAMRQAVNVVGELARTEVDKAMSIVLGLAPPEVCSRAHLLGRSGPPEHARAEILELEGVLARGYAEASAGRHDTARATYQAVATGGARLAWAPLEARAWMAIGDLELRVGDSKRGDEALAKAIDAASRAHDDALVADTLIKMLSAVTFTSVHTAEAERTIRLADAAVTRAGNDPRTRAAFHEAAGLMFNLRKQPADSAAHYDKALALLKKLPDERARLAHLHVSRAADRIDQNDLAQAEAELEHARAAMGEPLEKSDEAANYLNMRCFALLLAGKLDDAHAACVRARELFAARFGPSHPDTNSVDGNLANVLLRQGKGIEALALMERNTAATQATYGAEHPQTLLARHNLADALEQLGKPAVARDHWKTILAARERALGKDHAKTAEIAMRLAGSEIAIGDTASGIANIERALPVLERHYGREHDLVVTAINVLATAYHASGKRDETIALLGRAREILKRRKPDDPNIGILTYNIGELEREMGKAAQALAKYDEALAILGAALPPTHAILGHVHTSRGEALNALGRGRDAIAALERALPNLRAAGDEVAIARNEIAVAEALYLTGERGRASTLLASAEAKLAAAGPAADRWRTRANGLRARLR